MRILGAILAGGQSRRFGSDKADALFEGRPLLDHVASALRPQVHALAVAGRNWPGLTAIDDVPEPGLGPLGGLAGALDHAWRNDYDAVLSCGCDLIGVPYDLVQQLGVAPVVVDDLPIAGLWPVSARATLIAWLADTKNRSVYRFAEHIGARRVTLAVPMRNINRPGDLD